MQTRVKWVDKMSFLGESGSGHAVLMDVAEEAGGSNLGIRPMEMLLIGMGGCSSFDVVTILKKSRQKFIDVEVEISAERSDSIPKVFKQIHLHYIVRGEDLSEAHVKRAISLSMEKYCSASSMLSATAEISYDYAIEQR